MSQLSDLLEKVKEENLDLPTLEKYRDAMVHLNTSIQLECASLKKKEALYFLAHKEESGIANKMAWRCTPEGERQLDLEAYKRSLPKEIESLKSRIYALL